MTAVDAGRDVHVLGYFFDPEDVALERFLERQRAARIERVREIASRLHSAECPDRRRGAARGDARRERPECRPPAGGRCAGRRRSRKSIAATRSIACSETAAPAFVPRCGPDVAERRRGHRAGWGLASLAHPGLLGVDDRIAGFAERRPLGDRGAAPRSHVHSTRPTTDGSPPHSAWPCRAARTSTATTVARVEQAMGEDLSLCGARISLTLEARQTARVGLEARRRRSPQVTPVLQISGVQKRYQACVRCVCRN